MDIPENKSFIKLIQTDDKNAIDLLYARYSKRLFKFAFSYLKTEDDSLDVVQEVFVSVWENRKKLNADTNWEAYLFTVAKNTILSIFRKKISEKNYLDHLRQISIVSQNSNDEQLDYNYLSEKIQSLIDQLPEQRKLIFRMSKIEGQSNKAIAEKLNISVKTVEDHMTKARKFIKIKFDQHGLLAILFYELFI